MQHIDVNKKRPARWPWLLGAGILVLVVWGATVLLRPPAPPEAPDDVITAADTLPPALIPSGTQGSAPARESGLEDTGGLNEERLGERIRVEGEVIATGSGAFWVLTGGRLLRVDSSVPVRTGDTLSVQGTISEADSAATNPLTPEVLSRHPESDSWIVLRTIKLVDVGAAGAARPTPADGG